MMDILYTTTNEEPVRHLYNQTGPVFLPSTIFTRRPLIIFSFVFFFFLKDFFLVLIIDDDDAAKMFRLSHDLHFHLVCVGVFFFFFLWTRTQFLFLYFTATTTTRFFPFHLTFWQQSRGDIFFYFCVLTVNQLVLIFFPSRAHHEIPLLVCLWCHSNPLWM